MLKELVEQCRSYRRFYENEPISTEVLKELVNLARISPTGGNAQPLKFKLTNTPEENGKVFETLGWAAALPDWAGPEEGERPSAYITILCDLSIGKNKLQDNGIASHVIMLGAVEKGLGGCIIATVNRKKLAENLNIDTERYSIDLVLALGKPKETVVMVPVEQDGSTKYYRDSEGVHYVPKRSLEDIII